MTHKDTGGQAFACIAIDNDGSTYGEGGMTLHDYFAASAMQALITSRPDVQDLVLIAKGAYATADAMIMIRKGLRFDDNHAAMKDLK